MDDAKGWLGLFLMAGTGDCNGGTSRHWTTMKSTPDVKLRMIPLLEMKMQGGSICHENES